jgi:hypothetical protein
MVESSDSPEVQAFMAAFQKLRNLVDDAPDVLEEEAMENPSLANSCERLHGAAHGIRTSERSRRELFSAPTNPSFIRAWRDYEVRYSDPVGRIASWLTIRELFGDSAALADRSATAELRTNAAERFEQCFEDAANDAWGRAGEIRAALDFAAKELEFCEETDSYDRRYRREIRSGIDALRTLTDVAGFDFEGVFRRRSLAPFVRIPRHVARKQGSAESLSLLTLL